MIKLSASRKWFILVIFAVLVVCAFLATSLVPSIGHSGTGANLQSIYDAHSSPLPSGNNNSSSAGYVKYTLVLSNNTLIKGNFINTRNCRDPYDATFDSSNGYVYVTNEVSNNVSVISGTTNKVIDTIAVGSSPEGVSFDSSNGYVYVANYFSGTISIIGATTKTAEYSVTFTETGLPSGTSWSVTLNGTSESSTSGTITFTEPNGTYSYTVSSVSGYSVSSSSGSISVNGASASKAVSFTPINKSPTPSGISSTEQYGIIGAVAVVAAIGGVLAIMRKKR